jgi:hypothetical protein
MVIILFFCLLLRWGFKYEAAFFSLISFSIFTAVDRCVWMGKFSFETLCSC